MYLFLLYFWAKVNEMKKYITFILFNLFLISCEVDNTVYLKPIVVTYEPENILSNSFTLSGETLNEGGLQITEYGAVWSTNYPPTINDNKSIEGNGLGYFSNTYTNLEANTIYYCAAYAINEEGINYGGIAEFTTTGGATCEPQENYFEAETDLFTMQNGDYESTEVVTGTYYNSGGDYYLKAEKGYISDYVEVQVHFDGDFENLLSGVYPIVSDLDSSFQTPNKAVVFLRHQGSNFRPYEDDAVVYIEHSGDSVKVTLCELKMSGVIYNNTYTTTVTTSFEVSN